MTQIQNGQLLRRMREHPSTSLRQALRCATHDGTVSGFGLNHDFGEQKALKGLLAGSIPH